MTKPSAGSIARNESERAWPAVVHLTAAGVSLVLEVTGERLPAILHWGAALGPLSDTDLAELARSVRPAHAANGAESVAPVAVLPEPWSGWMGTPGISGHRTGAAWSPRFRPTSGDVVLDPSGGGSVNVIADDDELALRLDIQCELLPSGLLRARTRLTNLGSEPYIVDSVNIGLPVPSRADELFDLAGRWALERAPQQRRPFTVGAHLREGRRGRTGADAATVLVAGEPGFDFDRGEVWGLHVAFSGNHRLLAERTHTSERLLIGSELLLPGEVVLTSGESYETPKIYGAYGTGLDDLAARFHVHLRARPGHPTSPRPVVMNVWEAVYFNHDLDGLKHLADLGAKVGAERFVLDDGWFGDRRTDTAGLGDWTVSDEVWGNGRFEELVRYVKALGMEFGLWFEPEMANLDSDLARAHPEWLMQVAGRLPIEFRHQQVLDLTHPEAFEYLRSSIASLVTEHGIDYIKWDHNRDLIDAGSTRTGRAGVHEQTLAAYRLLDEIRAQCPGLEIESCSSGGARVDLEILERTDRVWASDCIDAHERQQIQRWTAQLLPPELIGSHIGADRAHTTGRRLDLSFRAATALFGHLGIEWDLTEASPEQLDELSGWIEFYTQERELIHSGRMVRRTSDDGALWLQGAIRADASEGLYLLTLRERSLTWPLGRLPLPGLDPTRTYRVSAAGPEAHRTRFHRRVHPGWWRDGLTLSGAVLSNSGVQVPALDPDQVCLIRVVAQA